jgi:hypothetical protein
VHLLVGATLVYLDGPNLGGGEPEILIIVLLTFLSHHNFASTQVLIPSEQSNLTPIPWAIHSSSRINKINKARLER